MGVMADVPAGSPGMGVTVLGATGPASGIFYSITMEQPVGLLLLTPTRSTGRSSPTRRQWHDPGRALPEIPGWGPVYAGSGDGPACRRSFRLVRPQKLTDNLIVLRDPAILPLPFR